MVNFLQKSLFILAILLNIAPIQAMNFQIADCGNCRYNNQMAQERYKDQPNYRGYKPVLMDCEKICQVKSTR